MPTSASTQIGFKNASYQWNTGKQSHASAKDQKVANGTSESPSDPSEPINIDSPFILADLNVWFPIGKLTVVTGPTGSGKTALLTALLGEMDLIDGEGYLPKSPEAIVNDMRDSASFAAQTPWLQQKSIKENILFGEPIDEKRYQATLDACALYVGNSRVVRSSSFRKPDLDILEDGDGTEIGAKGVSLRCVVSSNSDLH